MKTGPMLRTRPWIARFVLAAALAVPAGCGKGRDGERELAGLREQLHAVEVQLAQARAEKEALEADVERLKKHLVEVLTAEAVSDEALAASREEKARLNGRLAAALDTAQSAQVVAKSSETLAAEGRAILDRLKFLEAEVKKSRAECDALRREKGALEAHDRDLQAILEAKDRELANARTRIAALESVDPEADAKARLARGKKTPVAPGLSLPVRFEARPGEALRWVWAVVEGPPDLAAESVEFHVAGPDSVRVYSALAGREKKGDEGGVRVGATGTWTVLWTNRHPTASVTIQYAVYIVPAKR